MTAERRKRHDDKVSVFFFDEARFGLKPTTARFWCKKSKRPVVRVRPGYLNFYLYSAVNPETGDEFTLELPKVNTEMMNLYLAGFRRAYSDGHILLVMDQAGWHKALALEIPEGIEFVLLPPYSPELNPIERLWQWLRRHICRNRTFLDLDELSGAFVRFWPAMTPRKLSSICHCNYL